MKRRSHRKRIHREPQLLRMGREAARQMDRRGQGERQQCQVSSDACSRYRAENVLAFSLRGRCKQRQTRWYRRCIFKHLSLQLCKGRCFFVRHTRMWQRKAANVLVPSRNKSHGKRGICMEYTAKLSKRWCGVF